MDSLPSPLYCAQEEIPCVFNVDFLSQYRQMNRDAIAEDIACKFSRVRDLLKGNGNKKKIKIKNKIKAYLEKKDQLDLSQIEKKAQKLRKLALIYFAKVDDKSFIQLYSLAKRGDGLLSLSDVKQLHIEQILKDYSQNFNLFFPSPFSPHECIDQLMKEKRVQPAIRAVLSLEGSARQKGLQVIVSHLVKENKEEGLQQAFQLADRAPVKGEILTTMAIELAKNHHLATAFAILKESHLNAFCESAIFWAIANAYLRDKQPLLAFEIAKKIPLIEGREKLLCHMIPYLIEDHLFDIALEIRADINTLTLICERLVKNNQVDSALFWATSGASISGLITSSSDCHPSIVEIALETVACSLLANVNIEQAVAKARQILPSLTSKERKNQVAAAIAIRLAEDGFAVQAFKEIKEVIHNIHNLGDKELHGATLRKIAIDLAKHNELDLARDVISFIDDSYYQNDALAEVSLHLAFSGNFEMAIEEAQKIAWQHRELQLETLMNIVIEAVEKRPLEWVMSQSSLLNELLAEVSDADFWKAFFEKMIETQLEQALRLVNRLPLPCRDEVLVAIIDLLLLKRGEEEVGEKVMEIASHLSSLEIKEKSFPLIAAKIAVSISAAQAFNLIDSLPSEESQSQALKTLKEQFLTEDIANQLPVDIDFIPIPYHDLYWLHFLKA